jgi:hypothetical protein
MMERPKEYIVSLFSSPLRVEAGPWFGYNLGRHRNRILLQMVDIEVVYLNSKKILLSSLLV